ncbi:MAG: HD-GYP domain-containing protein [Methylomonas sp.]|jgi:HD-GYP domain-containing protein (c-di-GMP phosphodiesterase class II)
MQSRNVSKNINNRWVESTALEQIDVKDLKVGMYVSELDRPWLETSFWFQGFELKSQEDVKAVQAQCEYVFIEVDKKTKISHYTARSTAYGKDYLPPPEKSARHWFKNQIRQIETLHDNTSTLVKGFLEEVKFGRPINAVAAKKAVANCVDTILEAPNALMLMAQLKNRDEYTAQHSMNVCIYAIALGRELKLNRAELNNLGLCGMMHDMGKMAIPPEILNKPSRLTDEEMGVMETHPLEGGKILMSARDLFGGAIDVAHMHHERMDGKGYPRKLRAEQITPYAQMVAVVDIYDAITSDRVYQNGRTHLDALKIMNDISMQGHLNPQLTMKFIECLGIYPIGSLVEMVSGEVGVVVQANPNSKLKPTLMIIKDARKNFCNEYIADLAMIGENPGREDFRIKQIVRADQCGIDLNKYKSAALEPRMAL